MFRRRTTHKYGAHLTAGKSKLEHAVDLILSLRERAGDLRNLQRQQSIVLQEGPRNQRITLRIDFSWEDPKTGDRCFGEAKGFETPEWKLKLKLFRARPPGRLEIWGGTYKNPKLMEVIECPR